MKLLHCNNCGDTVSLWYTVRLCRCNRSWGKYYDDGLYAVVGGPCTPLGFANYSYQDALLQQPEVPPGRRFEAFVIEKKCPTIEVVDDTIKAFDKWAKTHPPKATGLKALRAKLVKSKREKSKK